MHFKSSQTQSRKIRSASDHPAESMCGGISGAAGFSLLSTMIAAAILGILTLATARLLSTSHLGAKSSELHNDISSLRENLRLGFDCYESLGEPAPSATLNCAAMGSIPILRADGSSIVSSGKLGVWTVTAGCAGDQIIFKAMKPGNDPLTGQPWAQSKSLRAPNGNLDLFRGTSSFCTGFFHPKPPQFRCPKGKVVAGVDFDSDYIKCEPGYLFGGSFMTFRAHPETGQMTFPCLSPNVLTGDCSCPNGFDKMAVSEFKSKCSFLNSKIKIATCSFYSSLTSSNWHNGSVYGSVQYACVR